MVTTGTYGFNPAASDVVLNAFSMIGVRRTKITQEHLADAAYQAQMVGVDFTNRQPNMWQQEGADFSLSAGVATYTLPVSTVAILAPTVNYAGNDRPLSPLSLADWNSLPRKMQTGFPTSYLFSLVEPAATVTLWPVPPSVPAMTMHVEIFRRQQDTSLSGGRTLDTPFRFLEAFTLGLAARLAPAWAEGPLSERLAAAAALKSAYEEAFRLAAALDQERVPLRPNPNVSSYYPR